MIKIKICKLKGKIRFIILWYLEFINTNMKVDRYLIKSKLECVWFKTY